MSGEIKKVDSIKNMAVFKDFQWNASVRDKGNNVVEFKKINILYGRNYSGKTTLSRIFRALETGSISDKYNSPEFQLSFDSGTNITQNSLTGHGQVIRVFNEDFVKENLRFIVDDEHAINSFAVLGEDNTKLEEEIEKHEAELGSEEEKSGLIGNMLEAEEAFRQAKNAHDNKADDFENKLRDKARNIKNNRMFDDAGYDIRKFRSDINTISAASYTQITTERENNYRDLLKEEPKDKIKESASFNLKYSTFVSKAKELVEKRIQTSEPIQELLSDAALADWVRKGREHHKGKRAQCAFCGSDLPTNLWEKLDKHFNEESEDLREAIEKLLGTIENEKNRIPNLLKIKKSDFYLSFSSDLEKLEEQFSTQSTAYCKTLDSIQQQLEDRKGDIFNSQRFVEPTSAEQDLSAIRDKYENLRNQSNDYTDSLSADQSKAQKALRLHKVFTFINDIKYSDECKAIQTLKDNMDKAEEVKTKTERKVNEKKTKISDLKARLKDESKGAERVNDYLNHFFGHQSLSLQAIANAEESTAAGYRFEVIRNDQKAFHLSQGECSLIAFCYFMAKLEDVETKGNQPIIWIDDPISSLDANHIFFVYSLIKAEIVKSKKFKQLFISTHNLDFLKYLKRISNDYKGKGQKKIKIREFFLIERCGSSSSLSLMPRYLKDYVTEFNFLFHQIYKCAHAQIECDENHDCYYNFGNNVRKFLEAFLYYKYPNAVEKDDKLARFFGDDALAVSLIDRINNEFSHLAGALERSVLPIDVPEMKTTAKFILRKIKEKDPDQYSALLQSIGVNDEPAVDHVVTVVEAQ